MSKRNPFSALAVIFVILAAPFALGSTSANLNTTKTDPNSHNLTFSGYTPLNLTLNWISAGNNFSLGIGNDGVAYSWGDGRQGHLGLGDTAHRNYPTAIPTPAGVKFAQVYAGYESSYAIGDDGNLYAWGYNDKGQLGVGDTANRLTPTLVSNPAPGVTYKQLSAGNGFAVAIGSDGITYAWGTNQNSVLGTGVTIGGDSLTPVPVHTPEGVKFTQVSAGNTHVLAIGADGMVYGWGNNESGRLGNNKATRESTPVRALTPENVLFSKVAAGSLHSMAVSVDGAVYAWGPNVAGQLGTGDTTQRRIPALISIPSASPIMSVTAGRSISFVVDDNGVVYSVGQNESGQMGVGDTTRRTVFTAVVMPSGVAFGQIATGDIHSIGITVGGKVFTWGSNVYGQLGIGANGSGAGAVPYLTVPTRVSGYNA